MAAESESRDGWRWPLLFLWVLYIAVGAFPEDFYYLMRAVGQVTTQRAFVNSHWLVYLVWIFVLSWFVVRRATLLGMPPIDAIGRGLCVLLVALVAFFPVGLGEVLNFFEQIPDPGVRHLFQGFAVIKGMALVLLLAVLVHYCLGARPRAREREH